MTRAIRWSVCPLLLLVLLPVLATVPAGRRVHGKDSEVREMPRLAADWWTLSDADFVAQYGNLATGTQAQQSQFAWMAFARANQPATSSNGQKFSQWELWPSDPDTFTPDTPRFEAARKVRTRPHLEPIQQLRMIAHRLPAAMTEASPFPNVGEEVTRNPTSYGYITGNGLNSRHGIAAYLGQPGKRIDFPSGAVEIKAVWVQGALPGAYQVSGLSLTGLHLMVKINPTPSNPFTDNSPSWFWTTFELKSNRGLAAAQKFVTYHDLLSATDIQALMTQAGLGGTPFLNYVSNGQQIQFSDASHPTIILGNTQLEWGFATPASPNPNTWTSWSSSCHTCHGQASGVLGGGGVSFFPFTQTGPIGPLAGATLPPAGYHPYDFVWALMRAQ